MAPSIIMHVNYCEQGQTIDEMCAKAVGWGYDGIEFRRTRPAVGEAPESYLDSIAVSAQRHGLKYVLFGSPGPNLNDPDPARRATEVAAAEHFYRMAAARFPLTVCNTFTGSLTNPDKSIPGHAYDQHGSAAATAATWEWAVEGFRHLGAVAAELGFRLAFETHMNYLHDLPAACDKLVQMIGSPAVGINLDYGNTVYFRNPPSVTKVIAEMGERIFYVHLKNSLPLPDGRRFPTGLGEGAINHREYLKALQAAGYNGPLGVEAPRPGDREWYARQDLAYIRSVLAEIGWQ